MGKTVYLGIVILLLCTTSISCQHKDVISKDPFVLEINTEDLNNIYATAEFVLSENTIVSHNSPYITFSVHDSEGNIVSIETNSMLNAIILQTEFKPGDLVHCDMLGKINGLDPGEYEIKANLEYQIGKTYSDLEKAQTVSAYILIPDDF